MLSQRNASRIIAQTSPRAPLLLACLRRRVFQRFGKFRPRAEIDCAEFQHASLKAMLLELLRDWDASEKLYAVRSRVTRMASG